jgi:hypothetical protein
MAEVLAFQSHDPGKVTAVAGAGGGGSLADSPRLTMLCTMFVVSEEAA